MKISVKNICRRMAAAALAVILVSGVTDAREKVKTVDYNTYKCRDMNLIWKGNDQRHQRWTQEQFVPNVSHLFSDGHRDWTFDGFIFLESAAENGATFYPSLGVMGKRSDWQWWMDQLFERGVSLDALDKCIDSLKTEIGEPPFRHKILLGIPAPCPKTVDWGEVDGKVIDMSNPDDATLATKWFIDEMVARYHAQNYKNIDLIGLYWIDEDMCNTGDMAARVEPLVHAHDLDYCWIPYFNARGIGAWRDWGFDMVWIQPGYLFNKGQSPLRLKDAMDYARGLGFGMELEMERSSLFGMPESTHSKVREYVDWFENAGVWDRSGVAYYTGTDALNYMAKSTDPEDHELMDRLFNIIVKRRSNPKLIKE